MQLHLNDNGLTHLDQALAAWENVDLIDIQNNPFWYVFWILFCNRKQMTNSFFFSFNFFIDCCDDDNKYYATVALIVSSPLNFLIFFFLTGAIATSSGWLLSFCSK